MVVPKLVQASKMFLLSGLRTLERKRETLAGAIQEFEERAPAFKVLPLCAYGLVMAMDAAAGLVTAAACALDAFDDTADDSTADRLRFRIETNIDIRLTVLAEQVDELRSVTPQAKASAMIAGDWPVHHTTVALEIEGARLRGFLALLPYLNRDGLHLLAGAIALDGRLDYLRQQRLGEGPRGGLGGRPWHDLDDDVDDDDTEDETDDQVAHG